MAGHTDRTDLGAPQHALARLGARVTGALGVRVAPSAATIRRIVNLVCPAGLADLTGTDPGGADSVAVDGKAARGSRHGQTPAAHLLAAMTGDGRTVTQLRVPDKTNEITCFATLLEPYDLTGVTVTADALHTQRGHVRFLVEEKKAHYLFVVKANQPELHRRLRSLPWKDVTARRYDREAGHGRKETRATRALTITGLDLGFPHAVQAVRILRHRTDLKTGTVSRQTVYAITDLTSQQASPQRLGQLARESDGFDALTMQVVADYRRRTLCSPVRRVSGTGTRGGDFCSTGLMPDRCPPGTAHPAALPGQPAGRGGARRTPRLRGLRPSPLRPCSVEGPSSTHSLREASWRRSNSTCRSPRDPTPP
ncbi:ISAs1 family transposase [Kitasatospora aureofaciens]|uniref:ISAs1 family transposase n=1 Tax=Kitasatospora aureofaciens TaxID=1894 RepID=UPI00210C6D1D|nr:ISAs1 family transposase [Kitasatospora aureofaciens]